MIDPQDVHVLLEDLHSTKVHEVITTDPDGYYTIILNARSSYSDQLRAYEHAMKHIINQDFDTDSLSATEIEKKRHQ